MDGNVLVRFDRVTLIHIQPDGRRFPCCASYSSLALPQFFYSSWQLILSFPNFVGRCLFFSVGLFPLLRTLISTDLFNSQMPVVVTRNAS